jgi:hypothetical protein
MSTEPRLLSDRDIPATMAGSLLLTGLHFGTGVSDLFSITRVGMRMRVCETSENEGDGRKLMLYLMLL